MLWQEFRREAVVQDHAKNTIVLNGRYGTVFCSALFVKAPVIRDSILNVEIVNGFQLPSKIDLTLNAFLKG
jgi:hypothetical protein